VRPSAIETGTPVSISAINSKKMVPARNDGGITMMPALSPRQMVRIRIGARIRINPSGLVLPPESSLASACAGCRSGAVTSMPSTWASL
jgi:hypothetical protein